MQLNKSERTVLCHHFSNFYIFIQYIYCKHYLFIPYHKLASVNVCIIETSWGSFNEVMKSI